MSPWYRWDGADLVLSLRVQPRASRDGFAEVLGDSIKLRITAPPVDGKANAHLVAYLAKVCGVGREAVSIESGTSGRSKRVRVRTPASLPPGVAHAAPAKQPTRPLGL